MAGLSERPEFFSFSCFLHMPLYRSLVGSSLIAVNIMAKRYCCFFFTQAFLSFACASKLDEMRQVFLPGAGGGALKLPEP